MIGIYGGTFDPVHFGHLRPALDVLQTLKLEHILFIPCGTPPHRNKPVASASQRAEMLQMAIHDVDGFVFDDRELRRKGKSYMVDTIAELKAEYPGNQFCLIVGLDAFIEFTSWKQWQRIVGEVALVVTHRPGVEIDMQSWQADLIHYVSENQVDKAEKLTGSTGSAVYFCPVTQLDISSTQIRALANSERDVHFLLPNNVVDYIEANQVYV